MSIDYSGRKDDLDFLYGKSDNNDIIDRHGNKEIIDVNDSGSHFVGISFSILVMFYLLKCFRNGLIVLVAATVIFGLYIDSHNYDTRSPYSKILSCSYFLDNGSRNCSLFNASGSNVSVDTVHTLFIDADLTDELKKRSMGNEFRIFANSEEHLLLSYIGADSYSITVPSNIRQLEESVLIIAKDGELTIAATKSLTPEDSEHINNLIKRSLNIMGDPKVFLETDYGKHSSEKLMLSYIVDFFAKLNALATKNLQGFF